MNKSDLLFLEKVFSAEINGGMLQSKSKQAKRLEEDGYIQEIENQFHDRFGTMTAKGYVLTLLGNYTYCSSEYVRSYQNE